MPRTPRQPLDLARSVAAAEDRLTDADRRLAAALLADPARATYLSANEAARQAGVHPTSAVRFARKLGFENYSDLRAQLRGSAMPQADAAASRMRTRLQRVASGRVLQALVDSEIRAMQDLPGQVSDAQLEAAARLVVKADRILVCGTGHAATLSALLALRLDRSGYNARGLDRWDWRTLEALSAMQSGDLLIAVSFRRTPKALAQLIAEAGARGVRTLVITDLPGFQPRPDVALAAHRGSAGESQSLTVPMAICNALVLDVARLDKGKSMRALYALTALRRKLPSLD